MNNMERYFSNLWMLDLRTISAPSVTMDEHSHPAFISCSLKNLEDIPTMLIPYARKALALNGYDFDSLAFNLANGYDFDSLAFNLANGYDHEGRRTIHHKTVSTILRMFAYPADARIAHIVTSKEVHYYGCKGAIFDVDYNPLFISTVSVETENGHLRLSNPTCKISYRVFNNASELLEKTIIKQAIPLYSARKVYCGCDSMYSRDMWVRVVIDDLDYMVQRPVRPRIEEVTPKKINDIIANNYDGS